MWTTCFQMSRPRPRWKGMPTSGLVKGPTIYQLACCLLKKWAPNPLIFFQWNILQLLFRDYKSTDSLSSIFGDKLEIVRFFLNCKSSFSCEPHDVYIYIHILYTYIIYILWFNVSIMVKSPFFAIFAGLIHNNFLMVSRLENLQHFWWLNQLNPYGGFLSHEGAISYIHMDFSIHNPFQWDTELLCPL